MSDYPSQAKLRDHYIFKKAEDFFEEVKVDGLKPAFTQPKIITYDDNDQFKDGSPNPACSHGRVFRFNDGKDGNKGSCLLIQFLRPRVWRIRFNPEKKSDPGFSDYNT